MRQKNEFSAQNPDAEKLRVEIAWLRSHPKFDLSEQMVRLLDYLAQNSGTGRTHVVSQQDIALDVLSHTPDFDPSSDAHVRIKVYRLRVALNAFYEKNRPNRAVRVVIPKGRYRVELVPAIQSPTALLQPQQAAPKLAICIMHAQTPESDSIAFEFETGVLQRLAQSPLLQDGALAAITVHGQSISAALDSALATDSAMLAIFRVCVAQGTARIAMLLFDPKDRRSSAECLACRGAATRRSLPSTLPRLWLIRFWASFLTAWPICFRAAGWLR